MKIISFAVCLTFISCSKGKADSKMEKKEADSIAFGWMKDDVSSVVWLNGEPISWLNKSGYLRIWDGEPLKRVSNVLRVDVTDNSNNNINWLDFNLRTVVDGKSQAVMSDSKSSKGEFHFDIVNTKIKNEHSLELGIVDVHTKQQLQKWSLAYLEKIELKDINSITKMIGPANISEFCPWASEAMIVESRVRNLNQMSYVQGKSYALIYPSSTSEIDALLVAKAGNATSKINFFVFIKAIDGNFYFKTRESQQYIRVFITE